MRKNMWDLELVRKLVELKWFFLHREREQGIDYSRQDGGDQLLLP